MSGGKMRVLYQVSGSVNDKKGNCKKCNLRIKREIALRPNKTTALWFHILCFFGILKEKKTIIEEGNIRGFEKLHFLEKEQLRKELEKNNKEPKGEIEAAARTRRNQLDKQNEILEKMETAFSYISRRDQLAIFDFNNYCPLRESKYQMLAMLTDMAVFGVPQNCEMCDSPVVFYDGRYVCTGYKIEECRLSVPKFSREEFKLPEQILRKHFSEQNTRHSIRPSSFNRLPIRIIETEEEIKAREGERDEEIEQWAGPLFDDFCPSTQVYHALKEQRTETKNRKVYGIEVKNDPIFAELTSSTPGDHVYQAFLTFFDWAEKLNSFVFMQVPEKKVRDKFVLHIVFGKLGEPGKVIRSIETHTDRHDAVAQFVRVFRKLTGNLWEGRETSVSKPGFYNCVHLEFKNFNEPNPTGVPFVPPRIEKFINSFASTELNRGFDVDNRKLPCGILTSKQFDRALNALNELSRFVTYGKFDDEAKAVSANNEFFKNFPSLFNWTESKLLNTSYSVEMKQYEVKNLKRACATYLRYNGRKDEKLMTIVKPIDVFYKNLNCSLTALEKNSPEWMNINEQIRNTIGTTHTKYRDVRIIDILSVDREAERGRDLSQWGNRKLLFHGTTMPCLSKILRKGLTLPDPPGRGSMFGDGIYFADMFSKSFHYSTRGQPDKKDGFIFLCEVGLGTMLSLEKANKNLTPQNLPPNYNSVKGVGTEYPNPQNDYAHPDGYIIHKGKKGSNSRSAIVKTLAYNEFVVYNVEQIKLKYLIHVRKIN